MIQKIINYTCRKCRSRNIIKNGIKHPDRDNAIDQNELLALIRAAAKNHERVTLVCEPADYAEALSIPQHGEIPFAIKKKLTVKDFKSTASYDMLISNYLDN